MRASLAAVFLFAFSLVSFAADPAPAAQEGAKPSLEANFKPLKADEIQGNVFKMVSKDWMLLCAGKDSSYNAMTAGWGGFGVMWSKPVTFILVKQSRYTYEFLEKEGYYTLCFLDHEKYKKELLLFGTKSGRDMDKFKATGLTPIDTPFGKAVGESSLIIACKKSYGTLLNEESTVDKAAFKAMYPGPDVHKLYFGEIVGAWARK